MYKNNKILKRIISLTMTLLLLLPTCAGAFNDEAALTLQSLEIIDKVPFEELRLEDTITRAEFAKVITKMLGFDNMDRGAFGSHFEDVDNEHWAAAYINASASLGLFEGNGSGLFYPEENILLQDAVKTVVTLLGYKVLAQEQGYPYGYILQATGLGLLKGISAEFSEPALRLDVFQLVYNALDAEQLSLTLTTGDVQSYEIKINDTIRNFLMRKQNEFEGSGIITATYDAYLIDPVSTIQDDEVEIDGIRYKTGISNAEDYLGVKVDFAAYEDEETGKYTLEYVIPNYEVNILNIDSDEFEKYSNREVTYFPENSNHTKKAVISESAAILYNNRPITAWSQFDIKNGDIKLIDNDEDRFYDVVLISDYISFPVKSVDENECIIKLKDAFLYKGVNAVLFDTEDDDVRRVVYDTDGKTIGIEDIEEDSLISIFTDGNGEYEKIIAETEKITGVISKIDDEGLTIDGVRYDYEIKDLLSEDDIGAGDEVTLYLNFEGNVGYIELIENKDERYGYIIGAETRGLSDSTVYIATAGKMQKRVDNLDNDPESNNTVTVLVSSNSSVEKFKLAGHYTIRDQYGSSLRTDDITKLPEGEVVKFRTNGKGELAEITYPEILDKAGDKTYNARDNVFGKGSGTPFGIDDDTLVLCVPESKVESLDDYLAEVEMENGQQYKVCGYDFEQSNCNVKLLMIEEAMKYENSGSIGVNTSIAIVQDVTTVLNEDGLPVTQLVLLTKELGVELNKTVNAASYADNSKIAALKIGDVIYYSQNSRKELVDFNSVMSLDGDTNYTNTGEGTDNEIIYGSLYSLLPNQIDVLMNRRAYSLTIQTDEYNPSKMRMIYPHITNSPPVFIYDKNRDHISFGTFDSMRTAEIFGGECDDIFVHLKNNTVQGIVLVRESGSWGDN